MLSRLELCAHVVLFANKNKLPRRSMILVLEEVVHAEPEIFQTQLAKILARNGERIEVVFFQVASEFPPALLVFSPNKTGSQKEERRND